MKWCNSEWLLFALAGSAVAQIGSVGPQRPPPFVDPSTLVNNVQYNPSFRPPSIPLAVRSPYLNTWLRAGSLTGSGSYSGMLTGQWPSFWSGATMGMKGFIMVDGVKYQWLGSDQSGGTTPFATQVGVSLSATKTTFQFQIMTPPQSASGSSSNVGGMSHGGSSSQAGSGPQVQVKMTVDFISPITPSNLEYQSVPMTYIVVSCSTADGSNHELEVYLDMTSEWASGDRNSVVQWTTGNTSSIHYHQFSRQTQQSYSEVKDQAEWGNWYFVGETKLSQQGIDAMTMKAGAGTNLRNNWASKTVKLGLAAGENPDTNPRAINSDYPTFAFSRQFGLTEASEQTVFAIGHLQQNIVQYSDVNGYTEVPALWRSYYANESQALDTVWRDFAKVKDLCAAYDAQLQKNATEAVDDSYYNLAMISARQAFGALQWGGTKDKPLAFLKETGSGSNIQTTDVIMSALPAYLYSTPEMIPPLLTPLLDNQINGQYPMDYAMHDLGVWPNATGRNGGNDIPMPVETTSDMLIMSLMYAQFSGNFNWLAKYYDRFKQWAEYLKDNALYPSNQQASDTWLGPLPNGTNLALKGIIGIGAFGKIAYFTNNTDDSNRFTNMSQQYVKTWQGLAFTQQAPKHVVNSYGDAPTSWGLLHSLYYDRILNLSLVPQEISPAQSDWYKAHLDKYGVSLAGNNNLGVLAHQSLAASLTWPDVTKTIFDRMSQWANQTVLQDPLPDLYHDESGVWPMTGDQGTNITLVNRPTVGGIFAPLALKLPNKIASFVPPPKPASGSSSAGGSTLGGGSLVGTGGQGSNRNGSGGISTTGSGRNSSGLNSSTDPLTLGGGDEPDFTDPDPSADDETIGISKKKARNVPKKHRRRVARLHAARKYARSRPLLDDEE